MHELDPDRFPRLRQLFLAAGHHLALQAALDRAAPCQAYVDDPRSPRSAFVWVQRRIFLGGYSENEEFTEDLRLLFKEKIAPLTTPNGKPLFTIHLGSAEWESSIDAIVADEKHLFSGVRRYYEHRSDEKKSRRVALPAEFSMRHIDLDLIGQERLQNLDALKEEMCSERASVDDFLAHGFGLCLLRGEELVGWCLSEYDHQGRCEVGIEVIDGYRRRGLGTTLATAFMEIAQSQGVSRIGWHCRASNTASNAAALKAGFDHVMDYPVRYAYFGDDD